MFRTQFSRQDELPVICESGSRYHAKYASRYDDNGVIQLIPDGVDDIYIQIQSHAPSTDINNIVKRYTMGDPTALDRRASVYMDVTGMPTNFADLLNVIREGEEMFDRLPLEEKQKYGNDFAQWLVRQGDEAAQLAPADVTVIPESEVVPNA